MQQAQRTTYADITEVRMETWAADCKKLLADGWLLLGVYPLTTVGEPPQRRNEHATCRCADWSDCWFVTRPQSWEGKPSDRQRAV
jgi:hypothetical protein